MNQLIVNYASQGSHVFTNTSNFSKANLTRWAIALVANQDIVSAELYSTDSDGVEVCETFSDEIENYA